MPRKSAAATATLDPRGRRLEPPLSLSKAEREAFVDVVKSVRPGHFNLDDMPLLITYAAAAVQERTISRKLEAASSSPDPDDKAEAVLWAAHARVAGSLTRLARALRLGAMARNPSRHRRGVAPLPELSGALPWEYYPDEKPN
jgi:hypothetical protein